MSEIIIAYFASLLPMLIMDGVWLFTIAKNFYAKHIGSLMAKSPNLIAGGLFYILYALGLAVLIVLPAIKDNTSFLKIFLLGALFGLVAYGTYDLTNLATIQNWPIIITIVDILWGTLYTGIVSMIAVYLTRLFV